MLLDSSGNGGSSGTAASGGGGTSGTSGTSGSGGIGGTSGTSGSSGTGGIPEPCFELQQFGPAVPVLQQPNELGWLPRLTPSSGDGQQLTVAFVRQPIESPGKFFAIGHTSFRPWQAWPATPLGPVHDSFASPELLPQLAVTRSGEDQFAMLVAHTNVVSFAPSAPANSSGAGSTVTLKGSTVRFATRSLPGRWLVGTETVGGELLAHTVTEVGGLNVSAQILGCAQGGVLADAVPYKDGWLVAVNNSIQSPPAGCSSPSAPGPALRVDLLYFGSEGFADGGTIIGSFATSAPLTSLAVAPYSKGMYVVWIEQSGGVFPPMRWTTVDAGNQSVSPPEQLTAPGDLPTALAATSLGDRLAVAWVNDPAGNPPDMVVSVRDADGTTFIDKTFDDLGVAPSIAASPNGRSLVVAWIPPFVPGDVNLMRLDCIAGFD